MRGRISSQEGAKRPRIGRVQTQPRETYRTRYTATSDASKWTNALRKATKQTFHKATSARARPWISDEILEALTQARKGEAEGETTVKSLRNRATRMAKKDKHSLGPRSADQ